MNYKYTLHNDAYADFRAYLDGSYKGKNGDEILGLSVGYPEPGEFPLPKVVLQEMAAEVNGIEKPRPGYGWDAGSTPLRENLVKLENLLHGTHYVIGNICMVAGATYAFNRIVETLFLHDPGKKLLVVAPTYYRMLYKTQYYAQVYNVVGKEENEFQITVDDILETLEEGTKAIFLANPTNPTYIYYENEFFEKLIPELEKRKVYLIVDESGDAFHLGTGANRLRRYTPALDNEYVIRIVTASKKYLYAEYRIGYVLAGLFFMGNKQSGFIKDIGDDIGNAPLAINDALLKITEQEIALIEDPSLAVDNEFYYRMNANNEKMSYLKDLAKNKLKSCPHITNIIEPDANFNITFKINLKCYKRDVDFFQDFLEKEHISILPCSGLGIPTELMYFRLTYGIREDKLIQGLDKMIAFINTQALS